MSGAGDFFKRSWFTLLMLVLGIAFIAGYFGYWRDQAASCTEPITATITRSDESMVTDDQGTRYEYRIVAEYVVDGETYSYEETTNSYCGIGDSYKLVYNPDDPSKAMTPGSAKMMWAVPVVGLAMIAYSIWSTGIFNRRSAHSDRD